MSDILFDVTAYTSRPSSFTDYELDTQGWDDQPPPVARPATGQNTGNSLGFKEGSRIHLTLHPSKTGTISHYHKPTGGWWVNWDNGNNYAVPGESLELDPNSLGFKESDRPTSVPKYRFYIEADGMVYDGRGFTHCKYDAKTYNSKGIKAAVYQLRNHPEVKSLKHRGISLEIKERFKCSSEPVDSSRELEDSLLPRNESVDLTGECQLNSTTTRLESCARTSTIPSGTETSEIFTQDLESMTPSLVDGLVKEPPEQVKEADSITQSQACGENSSDASVNADPSSYSWSNLKDLSITDFERGLEECVWQDIKLSLLSCCQLINLERCTQGSESLRCPTPTSGDKPSPTTRAAGQTKCERWFKEKGLLLPGSQLSSEALALLQGFPAHWFHSLRQSPSPVERQDESEPDTSQVEQSPRLKPSLPSNGSSGCGERKPQPFEEEKLEPQDESAIGKSYWCDVLDKVGTIVSICNWRRTPREKIIKAARLKWWWGNDSDIISVPIPLSELEEIQQLYCLIPESKPAPKVKSPRKRSPNKKPASGSLSRCVSVKKGKEYSTFQYNYDIKDPSTKRGWRTVKEGVPKCLSGALADAISQGKPIREVLTLLGKEPRGEISE